MSCLPGAKPSPRIEHGVIMWYAGDTFDLDIALHLTDQDGEDIIIGDDDRVEVEFRRRSGSLLHRFVCTAEDDTLHGNTITLIFDERTAAMFARGEYIYDIYLVGAERTTIANDNCAMVE